MKQIRTELLALDLKDQKILAQLFRNGRASFAEIAKATQLSKDVVQYRIGKFIETGVMTNVSTIVDASKFGWQSTLVFFKLVNLDKTKIKGFINYLVESPFVVEILELAGGWDFAARFYYKQLTDLSDTIGNLEKEFSSLIAEHQIFFISKNIFQPYNILFEKYKFDFQDRKAEACKLDELDFKILAAISVDSRKSLEQLSKELKENRMTIYNRIKKMISANVILQFRPNLFTEKLGFHWYAISMKLNDRSEQKLKLVVNKIKGAMPIHLIMSGFGFADIVIHAQVKTVQDLQRVLYSLREELSADLKSIESANVIKDYKWDFFPKGFLEAVV